MSDFLPRLKAALAGRYQLGRELGRGGMAVVYLADDLKHRRKVAVKVLLPELAQSIGADRFLSEIAIAAQLTHPHILPLHDSAQADGFVYYVMPYVEGESLRDRLSRERQLPMADAVEILKDVASALGYAHSRGIVHRDIKPENILLSGGHAVVSDFGIARAVDAAGGERLTETGLAVGTPTYMSPEQASGDRALDGRSDVYSLGCVAYELFGGEPPFTATSPQAVMARHSLDPVPRLKTLRTTVPEAIEHAIEQSLAKAPADRFATAEQFAEAVERGLRASPKPATGRRFGARRTFAVAAAAITIASAGWLIPRAFVGAGNDDILSLAVLPLENYSGDPEQEYFVAGMHDALITELAQVTPLRVISRRSVMRYRNSELSVPEIARELNVSGIIDGSVERTGDDVRLSVRLIRTSPDERHLWAEIYQRDVREVLAIHREITRAVVQQVGVPLSSAPSVVDAPGQVDPAVYEAYLRGMFELAKRDLESRRRGLDHLLDAVVRDPGNALAYAGLALGYGSLGHDDAVIPDALPRARAAAERAVTLDPNLAEAQAALALVKVYYERDWEGGGRAFRRALELNPSLALTHYHYSWYLLLFGHVEEAIAEHKRGQELDPFTLQHTSDLGGLYVWIGRPDDGIREAQKALAHEPDFPRALWVLGRAYGDKGMWDEAIEVHERVAEVAPAWRWVLGATYGFVGRDEDARRIARELERQPNTWNAIGLAYIYMGLGDHDAVFRWLAYEKPHAWVPWVRVDPYFAPLKDDPRFADLMRRMYLPPEETPQPQDRRAVG